MRLLVYARHQLVRRCLHDQEPALLLEGSWPAGRASAAHRSLDEAVDGRFAWIDRQAADFAEQLADNGVADDRSGSLPVSTSTAYLNALPLRYYLVKLIRLIAYFTEVERLKPESRLELFAASPRDEDYAELIGQICRISEVSYRLRRLPGGRPRAARSAGNPLWRRWLAKLSESLQLPPELDGPRDRVVLCGNPRLLDPVCHQLLKRRCSVWWLYDRFAVKSWLRWQSAGVRQLVCHSSMGRTNALSSDLPERVEYRGVDLTGPIRRWLAERREVDGPAQTRMLQQIDAHIRSVCPTSLVLGEDATPLSRACVAAARRYAVPSFVVQHGVPGCRFGFAPLAADRILTWGLSSQQRLVDWGVPPERIRIAGMPKQRPRCQRPTGRLELRAPGCQQIRSPRVLLLATVPPRDDRPDALALHLTSRTYTEMLRMAFATLSGIHQVELVVKLHPRARHDPIVRSVRAEFPAVRSRLVRRGPLDRWLSGVDCVLSCGSTAGIEAALAGLPVIQLAPPGADYVPSHQRWGLAGTARRQRELQQLLTKVLLQQWRPAPESLRHAVAETGRRAAVRIADEVLDPLSDKQNVPTPVPDRPHNPPAAAIQKGSN